LAATKELRGDAPADLVQERLHQISLGHRMLIGNPLYPESRRSEAK